MRVRPAMLSDLPQILGLGERMHRESRTQYPPIDPAVAERTLGIIVAHPEKLLALVAEGADGQLAGFLTAFISESAFSTELCAIHDIFFVAPERRGSKAASLLVDGFREWARARGCRQAMIAVHTGLNVERTGRFYEKKGFTHIGGVYMGYLH